MARILIDAEKKSLDLKGLEVIADSDCVIELVGDKQRVAVNGSVNRSVEPSGKFLSFRELKRLFPDTYDITYTNSFGGTRIFQGYELLPEDVSGSTLIYVKQDNTITLIPEN